MGDVLFDHLGRGGRSIAVERPAAGFAGGFGELLG